MLRPAAESAPLEENHEPAAAPKSAAPEKNAKSGAPDAPKKSDFWQ